MDSPPQTEHARGMRGTPLARSDPQDDPLLLLVALIRDLRRLAPCLLSEEEVPRSWWADIRHEEVVWWQQGWQATPALAVPTEPKLIPIPFLNKHHWRVAQDPDDLPAVAYRGPLTPVKIERLPVTQPAITNLVFRLPLIIGWGD